MMNYWGTCDELLAINCEVCFGAVTFIRKLLNQLFSWKDMKALFMLFCIFVE